MKRILLLLLVFVLVSAVPVYLLPHYTKFHLTIPGFSESKKEEKKKLQRLRGFASSLKEYASVHNYSVRYCFLVDMSLPSGRNRFFVYDLGKDSIVQQGLVAHGSCNNEFLEEARFSNVTGGGCSSLGKYKVGYAYKGRFGKAYKLYGVDDSNNNAFRRNVVLHAYDCVPDEETDPQPICNSLGCPMTSYRFLKTAGTYIDQSPKPVLLWIFN